MDVVVYRTEAEVSDSELFETLPLTFKFYKSDPLAVSLVFEQNGDEIPWQVSREMLSKGLGCEVGSGDVSFWPLPDRYDNRMAIWLESDEGSAYLTVESAHVERFLDLTEELLPMGDGEEELLIMGELNEWLESMR